MKRTVLALVSMSCLVKKKKGVTHLSEGLQGNWDLGVWSVEFSNLTEYALDAGDWAKSAGCKLPHLAFPVAGGHGGPTARCGVTLRQVRDYRLSEVSPTQSPVACKWRGWNLNTTGLDPKPKLLIRTLHWPGSPRILGTAVSNPSKGRLTRCMVSMTGQTQRIAIFCGCVFLGQKYLPFASHPTISRCFRIWSSRLYKRNV